MISPLKFVVNAFTLDKNLQRISLNSAPLTMSASRENTSVSVKLENLEPCHKKYKEFVLESKSNFCEVDQYRISLELQEGSLFLEFEKAEELKIFKDVLEAVKISKFCWRTEKDCATSYFNFYSSLLHQQNMLEDWLRTNSYYDAIMTNLPDFRDKVVLDVGAGTGILSFFAVQAGALRVYAVEASEMARHAKTLVINNKLEDKICVMQSLMEEVSLPEVVDIIISEPIGYMLFNERMLETFLFSKKWLKEGGIIFPSLGKLYLAPFYDCLLYMEVNSKASFWEHSNFYGVDFSSLKSEAKKQYFRQPIIDSFNINICLAEPMKHIIDFYKCQDKDLLHMEIPIEFCISKNGVVHGLAFWFDVIFKGSYSIVELSTCPTKPTTHWYQARCLIEPPLPVYIGQILKGMVVFNANNQQSYIINIKLFVDGAEQISTNLVDLKNPYFRYPISASYPHYQNCSEMKVDDKSTELEKTEVITEDLIDETRCSDLNAQKST